MSTPAWRRYLRFFGPDVEADIDDELRFHIDKRVDELVARGVDPKLARQRVLERFGSMTDIRGELVAIGHETQQTERRRLARHDLLQDVRYAGRILRRQKLAAAIIVLCLALGIGATTTVFSVGDALLLRPLPFPNGGRLVSVGSTGPGGNLTVSSFEDFTDWRNRQHTFDALAAMQRSSYTITGAEARRVAGAAVTSDLFKALGVRPLRGRLLEPADDQPGAARVVVVSALLADRALGGVDRAVGQSLTLNDVPHAVVGVLADQDGYPDGQALWASMPRAPDPSLRNSRSLDLIGLLKEGVTLDAALADLEIINAQLARELPDEAAGNHARIQPIRERYIGASRPAFIAIGCAALALLLIACANVASMQLARGASRAREIAVRSALGAGRGRLVRQVLTENVILAVAGGLLGIALALAANQVVASAIPASLASWMEPRVDLRVLAFTLAVSLVSGIAFGLAPARRLARVAPASVIQGGARAGTGAARMRLQRALVVTEIALALVLLVGATMAAQSFRRLTTSHPGYDAANIATFRIAMRGPAYDSAAARVHLSRALIERIRQIPGVASVAAASHLPIADCCSRFGLSIGGDSYDRSRETMVSGNVVTPEYFRTLGIALVRGRVLSDDDRAGAPEAMVINETFERQLFHGENAVGRTVHRGSNPAVVVGVVRDVKQVQLSDGPEPQFYASQAQLAWDDLTFAIKVERGDPMAVMPAAREALKSIDANLPPYRLAPMPMLMERAVHTERMFGRLLLGFAVIALVLASAGIYGVTSYFVEQRTSEMGIRLALGARPSAVLGMVASQAAVLAVVGMIIGGAAAWLAARALTRLLYGVSAGEPLLYLAAAGLLGATAVIACLAPARRAVAVDPMSALRAD